MVVNVSIPLNFSFKADDVLLILTEIFAPIDNATNHWPEILQSIKVHCPFLTYWLALLKSTLKDASLDLGALEFVPLSGDEPVIFDEAVCRFFLFPSHRVSCQKLIL